MRDKLLNYLNKESKANSFIPFNKHLLKDQYVQEVLEEMLDDKLNIDLDEFFSITHLQYLKNVMKNSKNIKNGYPLEESMVYYKMDSGQVIDVVNLDSFGILNDNVIPFTDKKKITSPYENEKTEIKCSEPGMIVTMSPYNVTAELIVSREKNGGRITAEGGDMYSAEMIVIESFLNETGSEAQVNQFYFDADNYMEEGGDVNDYIHRLNGVVSEGLFEPECYHK